MDMSVPEPLAVGAPAAALPNTMAAPANRPAAQAPAGAVAAASPVQANPPVGGLVDRSLPKADDMKAAALKRAEILSIFYKYGMSINKDTKIDVGGGAATGGLMGAGLGLASGALATKKLPVTVPVSQIKSPDEARKILIEMLTGGSAPTRPAGSIRAAVKAHGLGKILKVIGVTGLGGAAAGAGVGAGIGLGIHAIRRHQRR